MDSAEKTPVTPEVKFLPRETLYKEYGYSAPTEDRASLERKRFERSFEKQAKRDARTYAEEVDVPLTLKCPEIRVLKKVNGAYVYEMRLSDSYTMLLSAKPQSVSVGSFSGNIDAFRVEHLLVVRKDGQAADALDQYPRHVSNFLTFSKIDSASVIEPPKGEEYIVASIDVGIGNGHPHDLVYTLLHENAHVALAEVDRNRKGPSADDVYAYGPMAASERDADAFALRVGKRLGIDTRSQMTSYNSALSTYDEWTLRHGVKGNPALYASSDTRKKARGNAR